MQKLKAALQDRSVKTVNNCLSTLSTMLKVAVKWKVIDRIPVEVEHLKAADSTVDFYEVEDYERLVQAAEKLGPAQQLVVLLGGDAGLRMGMRYMHLGKGEKHRAIQMLEEGRDTSPIWRHSGDAQEPESTGAGNR